MDVVDGDVGKLQLPLGEVLDELMHLVGVLVQGDHRVGDLHEVMAHLPDAGGAEGHDPLLVAVHRLGLLHANFPLFLGELQRGGLNVLLPVLDVLDDDLVGSVDGEGAGLTLGPRLGHTPAVDLVELAGHRLAPVAHDRGED